MAGGRPRVYDNAEDLDAECEKFFQQCEDDNKRPTVSGLALFLGFVSKQSLYDYEKNEEFSYPIKRALLRVEFGLESRLDQGAVAGIIFGLKNMGWKDTQDITANINVEQITGMKIAHGTGVQTGEQQTD